MKEGEGKKTQKRQGQNVIELVSEYEKEKKRTRESARRTIFGMSSEAYCIAPALRHTAKIRPDEKAINSTFLFPEVNINHGCSWRAITGFLLFTYLMNNRKKQAQQLSYSERGRLFLPTFVLF